VVGGWKRKRSTAGAILPVRERIKLKQTNDVGTEIRRRGARFVDVSACMQGHSKGVRGISWRRDGRMLASCENGGTVWIWDAVSGLCVSVLRVGRRSRTPVRRRC
jgi:WD40 repeat protein